MRFENKTFTDETIHPEDNEYVGCVFEKCSVVFTASSPNLSFKNCNFKECRFGLGGAAHSTIVLLKGLYKNFGPLGRDFVSGTIREITA